MPISAFAEGPMSQRAGNIARRQTRQLRRRLAIRREARKPAATRNDVKNDATMERSSNVATYTDRTEMQRPLQIGKSCIIAVC